MARGRGDPRAVVVEIDVLRDRLKRDGIDLETRADEVPSDVTVYVICRSGARSAQAVEFLRGRGVDAVNVAGGTLAWIDSGRGVDSGPDA